MPTVRSQIASFEAHIHSDTASSTPDNSSHIKSKARRSRSAASSYHKSTPASPGRSTSTKASQNRISRLRQQQQQGEQEQQDQQQQHDEASAQLMEKRKQNKERRLLQHKRAKALAAAEGKKNLMSGSTKREPTTTTTNSEALPTQTSKWAKATRRQKVELSRRTKYRSSLVESSTAHPSSSSQRSATSSAAPAIVNPNQAPESNSISNAVASPTPGRTSSRMAKMQRMQKLKGYEHAKRASHGRKSIATSTATTPSVAFTSASTDVARNLSASLTRGAYVDPAQSQTHQETSSPPTSPHASRGYQTGYHSGMSPHFPTGSDVFSDSNYTAALMDSSVLDPVTDDEVTLTSVRRIVNPGEEGAGSPGSHSQPQYQEPPRLRSKSTSNQNGIHHNKMNNPTFQTTTQGSGYESISSPRSSDVALHRHRKTTKSINASTSSRSSKRKGSKRSSRRQWSNGDEASDNKPPSVFPTASSSDYDTDADHSNALLEGPSQSKESDAFFMGSRYKQQSSRVEDDDRTFDYGDRDESDSRGSIGSGRQAMSYQQQQPSNPSQALPETSTAGPGTPHPKKRESPLINKDDVEHYTKSLDTPVMKVGAGVLGAVTVGCIVLGPVGLLVGAVAVGAGVGYMQIPEEEREKMQTKAQKKINQFHDKAVDVSETLSTSCATTYNESGVADHLPPCIANIECLPSNGSTLDANDHESARSDKPNSNFHTKGAEGRNTHSRASESTSHTANANHNHPHHHHNHPNGDDESRSLARAPSGSNQERLMRNKKVACLRKVRILPAAQIHGLDPASQPRAWLDVLASANTTDDEKLEAMEEVLILAKDKRRARIFLDEGILDSIIWILSRYLEKVNANSESHVVQWAHPEISRDEKTAAKLAATCCVTLGKAHCAAIHTEGDLLLMSLYERGTVPEERQMAQMLHEVPHHVRITKTSDPTIIDPAKEVFALKQLTLPQAEELAQSIQRVADGQL